MRLSVRLSKALRQGLRAGTVSLAFLRDNAHTIAQMDYMVLEDSGHNLENIQFWKNFRLMEIQGKYDAHERDTSRRYLSILPVFKRMTQTTLEYFTIGQDRLMSLTDNWGTDYPSPLHLNEMTGDDLQNIAFLFGGVGDARHVYATLIGLHRASKTLSKTKRKKLRAHFTLLDFQPSALARDLCIMMLLEYLVDHVDVQMTTLLEVCATIFYTYVGVVMPQYCHDRLQITIQNLLRRLSEEPPRLPFWIHVDPASIPRLLEALRFWSTVHEGLQTKRVLRTHTPESPDSPLIQEYQPNFGEVFSSERQLLVENLRRLDPSQLEEHDVFHPGPNATPLQKWIFEARLDSCARTVLEEEPPMALERRWYAGTKVFLPPPELWSRHPGFEYFRSMRTSRTSLPLAQAESLRDEIALSWKANPTLLDSRNDGRQPYCLPNPFETPHFIEDFNVETGLKPRSSYGTNSDAPAFTAVADFFRATAEAVRGMKDRVVLEVLCGELSQEIAKMQLDNNASRPARFPKSRPARFPKLFTRAYVSNIPDYAHGLINTIVYNLPILRSRAESAIAATSFLNRPIWSSNEEFCYTYTLLLPKDLPRYLGCRVICADLMGKIILGKDPLPKPVDKLVIREELFSWPTRTLLYIIIPASSDEQATNVVRLPHNLVAFFGLLVHLQHVGYPSHWFTDFVQTMLYNNVATDIAPYLGSAPIPVSDISRRVPMRKIRLDPWFAEFENILALTYKGLPFAVSLPDSFAQSHTDIGLFESASSPLFPVALDRIPSVCLLFYKPGAGMDPAELVSAVPSILEGQSLPRQDDLYILTALQSLQCINHVWKAQWMFSWKRIQRLRREKWLMVVYHAALRRPITEPEPASRWTEVSTS
ncbi:hypothetical protein BKA93DRAFT_796987 [Sparassis latifolia]